MLPGPIAQGRSGCRRRRSTSSQPIEPTTWAGNPSRSGSNVSTRRSPLTWHWHASRQPSWRCAGSGPRDAYPRPRPGNAPGTHGNCRRGSCRARRRRPVQGIQQVAAGGNRPVAFADVQFRHTRSRIKKACTGNHARPSLTIVGCIGHRAGLYCRAFLASRQHHTACLGKLASADRCTTEATFIECSRL
jgi:hypothetical protein